jgi:hypothetical protein
MILTKMFHEFYSVFRCKVKVSFSNLEEYKVFHFKLNMILLFSDQR